MLPRLDKSKMDLGRFACAIFDQSKRLLTECMPERCPMCRSRAVSGFCPSCIKYLPKIDSACVVCGAANVSSIVCGRCQIRPPAQDDCVVALAYMDPVNRYIRDIKYNHQLHLVLALGHVLCYAIEKSVVDLPDVIVPIPLHRRRMRTRGFNHAYEIARVIARYFAIPMDHSLLYRSKDTITQTKLNQVQRRRNLKGAFSIGQQKNQDYSHVALVDDVITSGSTINEAARMLKSVGIYRVSAWAVAKTVEW